MPTVASWLLMLFNRLSLPSWYGVCAAALLGTWLVVRFTQQVWRWFRKSHHVAGLRRLPYSSLPGFLQRLDMSTYLEGSIVVLLLISNALVLMLRTHSTADIYRRAGILGVVHFIPLWTGLTFSLPADILGISRTTLSWSHRWIGRMCVLQSFLHGAMVLATADSPILAMKYYYIPLLVCKRSWLPLESSTYSCPLLYSIVGNATI